MIGLVRLEDLSKSLMCWVVLSHGREAGDLLDDPRLAFVFRYWQRPGGLAEELRATDQEDLASCLRLLFQVCLREPLMVMDREGHSTATGNASNCMPTILQTLPPRNQIW